MPSRDEYRKKAKVCIAQAELMLNSSDRAALLQMAHGYLKLADMVDHADHREDQGYADLEHHD